jgi:hypothetical protein
MMWAKNKGAQPSGMAKNLSAGAFRQAILADKKDALFKNDLLAENRHGHTNTFGK